MCATKARSLQIATHDGSVTAEIGERPFTRVEPQVGFALGGVGSVTGKAIGRQDRSNLAVEVDRSGGRLLASAKSMAIANSPRRSKIRRWIAAIMFESDPRGWLGGKVRSGVRSTPGDGSPDTPLLYKGAGSNGN